MNQSNGAKVGSPLPRIESSHEGCSSVKWTRDNDDRGITPYDFQCSNANNYRIRRILDPFQTLQIFPTDYPSFSIKF